MNFLDEFQFIVRKYSDRAALADCNGERITTYGELDVLSRRIAAKLVQSGEMSDRAVMVCMGRKMEYIASELGIMMAQAAFVPVLPEYPGERLSCIEQDCRAAAVIDDGWLSDIETYEPIPPAAREDGSVLLHTGDMGRRLPDGNYIYVNRKDWMVKINGQRVETGEIELRISSMPEVENAVVKAFEDENGQNYLCAYYVPGKEAKVKAEQIRTYLKQTLSDYMIPRFFKRLDSLPKNVNGKLDRTVLLPPGLDEYKTEYKEPQSDREKCICQGFEEVLHCGKVGVDDDFFKLGGDSINVLKLAEFLSDIDLTPEFVLKGRMPARIAAFLEELVC